MNKRSVLILVLFLIAVLSVPVIAQDADVDLESLLKEMVNREAIVHFPDPYYKTLQFSSYDRHAQKRGGPHWFANWDRSMFVRTEINEGRKEYVMFETDGPGAVVRFWMTFAGPGAGQGTLRIYFDYENEPTIEGKAFDILSGGALVGKPLSTSVSPKTNYERRGHNLYLPLPFSEHCKITYESEHIKGPPGAKTGGEAVYYNINYRQYESGTDVETFSLLHLKQVNHLLKSVQERLRERDKKAYLEGLQTTSLNISSTLDPGESLHRTIEGSGAIRRLAFKLEAKKSEQALRSTILKISFDGEQTVWVPIGDFFGTGYQYRPSNTWYTTVNNEILKAYWVMPFKDKAKVTVKNMGRQPVTVKYGSITYSDWKWDATSMHFGASWHEYTEIFTRKKNAPGNSGHFDINYTHLKGKGVYVGDVLTVFNTVYDWWGEGDEKIYIDGESFPSHFGTGTEDYYGYAWVRPEVFTNHPFISQPDGSGNITPGYTVNMRFRSLDAIPFNKELKVDMELWHWATTTINYAPTTFYYLKPGGEDLTKPDIKSAKAPVALKRSDIIEPLMMQGKIEGEKMVVDTISGGNIRYQALEEPTLSSGKQLWWRNGTVGDLLKAHFISKQSGVFETSAHFVVAPDYGTVKIWVNSEVVLSSFNGYHKQVAARIKRLGRVKLKEGVNTIKVKILGKSKTQDKAFFGLDAISFKEVGY